jgi:hypothetical protein
LNTTAYFTATLLLLTQGCSARLPPGEQTEQVALTETEQAPILPAIDADIYSTAPTTPRDHKVATAAAGLEWDESLSGAAANLAIDLSSNMPIDAASVRWAGLKAGWPYPVTYAAMELVDHQSDCPTSLLESIPAHTHVGIARARGASADAWVVLATNVQRVALPFSNVQALNSEFRLPYENSEGLSIRAYGSIGELQTGSSIRFDHEGEWVLEVIDEAQQTLILRAAIYVEGESPDYAPIEPAPADMDNTEAEILSMINEVRGHFVDGNLISEPLLSSTARSSLQEWIENGAPSPSHEYLGAITLTGNPPEALICVGETPRACVDQIYWSAQNRGALLNANQAGAGIASEVIDGVIHAVIHLAGN